jgi:type I restriction enzyme S subunit
MNRTVPIAEIASVNPRMPHSLVADDDREVNFVPMSHLSESGVVTINGTRRLREVSKGYTYFANGDVLVAKITPCMENGKAALVNTLPMGVGFGSTEFHVLRPGTNVDGRYLFYMVWNPHFRQEASRNMTGSAGQKRVPASFFERFEIPLPPLSEQRRIADILYKADAIRRKRREALDQVSALADSHFYEKLGDPVANPHNWPGATFNDHLTLVQYGPRFYNEAYSKDGVRIVRITDLDFQGKLDYSAMPLMAVPPGDEERFTLKPGDLLLARSGATVGKTALIDEDAPKCIAGAYFIRMRFSEKVRPLYAQMVMRSRPVQQIIEQKSKQSAQQNFNGPAIRALPLPVPPIELQDAFVAFHAQCMRLGKKLSEQVTEADHLFNSLVQRAFRGAL